MTDHPPSAAVLPPQRRETEKVQSSSSKRRRKIIEPSMSYSTIHLVIFSLTTLTPQLSGICFPASIFGRSDESNLYWLKNVNEKIIHFGVVSAVSASATPRSESNDPHDDEEEKFRFQKPRVCHVCGAPAGRHNYYGGQVCASCRAFFRRSVR